MEQWDLTSKISPYLDRHMTFPLLEYLDTLISSGTVSYASKDVAAARLALLRPTHMVDYAIDIYKEVNGKDSQVPKEMEDQKAATYKALEDLEKGCKALHELCGNEEEKVRQQTKLGTMFQSVRSVASNLHGAHSLSLSFCVADKIGGRW